MMAEYHLPFDGIFGFYGSAFFIGYVLGFGCLVGDSLGSFVKRRRGLERRRYFIQGSFVRYTTFRDCMLYVWFVLFPNLLYGSHQLIPSMIWLLILTPIIHRSVNVLGYKLGLKSVPY